MSCSLQRLVRISNVTSFSLCHASRRINPSCTPTILRSQVALMSSFKNTPNVGGPLLDTIIEDHKGIWSYYDEYANSAGDVDAQTRWANQFKWHVARHAIAEELVLYPLMEQHMGEEGKQIAEEDRGIHQRVKEILYELESHAPDSKEHAALLKEAVDILKQHGNHEEQVEFLKLQKALGDEGAAKAAASFERTKLLAPTR
ncbi:hypothetical protein D9613_009893 [Agrocybe pediades]|uniref:Hemerythrin-like domain-containing protein n=1 Tax=Agrocybe pediades TaxID=84607 RepID=A0A8H4QXX7_9AGAR|nr:hypothetical protein D9613_009893 [Agrocybe pediades]